MSYQFVIAVVFVILFHLSAKAESLDFDFTADCKPSASSLTIAFTGDVLIHDALYRSALESPQSFYSLFRKTAPLFAKADFTYGNLEGPVALGINNEGQDLGDVGMTYDLKVYSGTNFSFNYHPSLLKYLTQVGFNLMSTANNHALDRDSIGVDRTIEAFDKSELAFVGTHLGRDRNAPIYRITPIHNFNIAWISCTEMINDDNDFKKQLTYCYRDAEKIKATIRELSKRVDIDAVIVAPHWGEEYKTVNSSQQKYGHQFLEAGATAVVGSHPHVLQSWEKYVTADGRETIIAYSLGNFLAFQAGLEKKTGAVLYLKLSKKENAPALLAGAAYTPVYRDGYEVFPTSSPEVLAHAGQFLGQRALRLSTQPLWPKACP